MKKIILRFNIVIACTLLLSYGSLNISPADFWPAGFISIILPFLLILNIIFAFWWLLKKKFKYLVISLAVIVICSGQFGKLISFNFGSSNPEDEISILSSNVRIFNVYQYLLEQNPEAPEEFISWLSGSEYDILALQEYYNEPGNKMFEATKKISSKFPYYKVIRSATNRVGAEFGMAIFSRHPIINSKAIQFNNTTYNQAFYSDIKVGADTIRIINLHLESMHIEEDKLFDGENDKNTLLKKLKTTSKQLRTGFKMRARQIDQIVATIEESEYPVILCGDLNDTPFSYTYEKLSNHLNNAFEEKGFGIGSTYNGKIPFLRIDNQFFDKKFRINSFEIHDGIELSDHYPISASYTLIK